MSIGDPQSPVIQDRLYQQPFTFGIQTGVLRTFSIKLGGTAEGVEDIGGHL